MLTPWALRNKWLKKVIGLMLYQYGALRKAHVLHATAASELQDIRRLRLASPVVVAPLGVRLQAQAVPKRPNPVHTVLFVSRIHPKKGLPNLVAAWAGLPSALRAGWRMLIAGPDQGGHTAELKELCGHLGIQNEVEFLGPVFGSEKDLLYNDADIFVLPTYSENFGSVVIEALAASTPVVCTKGAPWEALESERCGMWIDVGVEPLRNALQKMMAMSDVQRQEMGARGRDYVAREYCWDSVAKRMLAAYQGTSTRV